MLLLPDFGDRDYLSPSLPSSSYVVVPFSIASSSFAFTCKFTHALNQNKGGAFMSSWATPPPAARGRSCLSPLLHVPTYPLHQLGYLQSSFLSWINMLKWQPHGLLGWFSGEWRSWHKTWHKINWLTWGDVKAWQGLCLLAEVSYLLSHLAPYHRTIPWGKAFVQFWCRIFNLFAFTELFSLIPIAQKPSAFDFNFLNKV